MDRTILRANLQLTTAQRMRRFEEFARAVRATRRRALKRNTEGRE